MKRFTQFSIGVLCLAIAALIGFHLSNHAVHAQSAPQIIGFSVLAENQMYAIDANGDVWRQALTNWVGGCGPGATLCSSPQYIGHFWGDQPISTSPSSLGGVKSQYAPKKP